LPHRWRVLLSSACLASLLQAACTGQSELIASRAAAYSPDPLEFPSLSPADDAASVPDASDILRLSPPMQAFVASAGLVDLREKQRLRRLWNAMIDGGIVNVSYARLQTRTAAGTFEYRSGNCLAYTNLFVALARASGLDVRYQIVAMPPAWTATERIIALETHINAVVRFRDQNRAVIDFNQIAFDADQPARIVDDRYAFALFYNNLAVEALSRGDDALAASRFRNAIRMSADVAEAWVNLGVLHARLGDAARAAAAYARALSIDPGNQSALSNLASLYRSQGQLDEAGTIDALIRRHQQRNPYYHFAQAQHSRAEGDTQAAIRSVQKAIRIKGDEPRFYALAIELYRAMNDTRRLEQSLVLAASHAGSAEARDRYRSMLEDLRQQKGRATNR
jgi:tetratricopeptide (TPR) repeat protein